MRYLAILLLAVASAAQQLPTDDAVRIAEFYRLAAQIQDQLWPGWSGTPTPLILVTDNAEFLTHHSAPPKDFTKTTDGFYTRPRQFDPHFLATFPAFGPPAVIVIGQAQNTTAKTSTPWLIVVMHEHFHQLQYGQPGYYDATKNLGLSHGDTSGMWILNYPFPYEKPEVVKDFTHLRDLLLQALNANDKEFAHAASEYVRERKRVFDSLAPDDHRYLSFQLWQEGIARYTQVKAAEAAANYQPTAEYKALPDYEAFSAYAARARAETFEELKHADLAQMKRVFVYSFGAGEGFLLDRLNPHWKDDYFKHPLSVDPLFEAVGK